MKKSFYIITIHDKEDLIAKVLDGINFSHSGSMETHVICVLDGCTDNSESIVKDFKKHSNFPIHIIYQDDVHEIKCINSGLTYIEDFLNPSPDDLVFSLQDDVILNEKNIDIKFSDLFNDNPNLGYVSMRLGASLTHYGNEIAEYALKESEFGAWKQLGSHNHEEVLHNHLVLVEAAIRSPTCMMWKRFQEAGFFDEDLAPAGFDCHDMSIRLNKLGYQNAIYALNYISDVWWGTMRSEKNKSNQPYILSIYDRNRKYLLRKHADYFNV